MQNQNLDKLIATIAKLPGLGPRSARRIVLHLIKNSANIMLPLAELIKTVSEEIITCEICGNIDTSSPCSICADNRRDNETICVVENISDLWALEKANLFKGKYHVLGGTLSALDGRTPESLNIDSLRNRIANSNIKEVIIATSTTLEGQTTGHYIVDLIAIFNVKATRLAYGIPIGADLDYMDEGTLSMALKMRNEF